VLVLLVLALFMLANAAPALADRAFATRFSANDTGNITTAANTLMVCPAVAPGCTAARTTPPIASGSNAAIDNNGYNMTYVNTAPGTVAGSATFDSSSATLSLPPTATVLFAGLYWGADTSAGALQSGGGPAPATAPNAALRGQIGFQAPGDSAYRTLTGSVDQSATAATRYGAFADVTSIVQSAGAGTYSVANVQAGTGGDRYAGWTLVVAYRDSTQPPRNLTIDDGFVTIDSSSPPTTIPITGFRTPPSGPVRTTLGFVSYEGDAGLTGDSASLNGTTLSDAASPPSNFFDAQISNLGTNVTTRTPNDTNNWDYDSKQVSANGILPNNATSANIVVTTNGDTYYPAVVTLATDLYAPNITSSKSVTNVTHPGGPDQRGDVLRYTVSYTNSGQDPATNFVMRDPIPSGTAYVPASLRITAGPQAPASPSDAIGDDAAEFNAGTGEVVFRLGAGGNATTGGTIAAAGVPGATVTATFDVQINSNAAPGQQLVNQATATFLGPTLGIPFTDTSPRTTNTVAAPALTIAKSHSGSLVGGEATTFTLAVSNVGTLATDGSTATVTDPFPASSFSALANAGGGGWNCSIAALTLTCTRSDVLAAGASYPPILVDATVLASTPATVSNTATVSGGGSAPSTGSDGGGTTGLADLSITKTAQPVTVPNGGQVTYTLNVQNAGPSAAQGVTVSDPVDPASYGSVVAQTTQGTCDTSVSCSLGTVDANSTVTITITATVAARDTTLTNTATVSSPTPDPHPANNTASASVLVPGSADLSVAKTGSLGPIEGGADSYTITVTNHGPDPASGVVVNDPLPPQFTATSATGASCLPLPTTGGTLVCTIGGLAVNGTATITITGTLGALTGGQTVVNAAIVSSNTADPDLSNNTATFNQLVSPAADLTITKHALLSDHVTPVTNPLTVGDTFDYQIGVINHGPSPAVAVQVTDTLPAGITLAAAVPGCAPGAGAGGTITCTIPTLAAGASQIFNLSVNVGPAAANSAPQNVATVSSATPDPNPTGSTTATTTVGVGAVANLSVHKSVSPATANVGDLVTYTYSVTNNIPIGESGGAPAGLATTGAVVTDPLPPGLQFVAAVSPGLCTATAGIVTCHLGPVAQGQVVATSFTARVTSAGAGTNVTNRATVATEAAGGFPLVPDYNPIDNSDAATVAVAPEAGLSLTKTVSNPSPAVDDEVVYTLTARNAGPDDATGVKIQDSLPAGLDFIDASPGCDNNNGTVTCDLGTLANGAQASVTVRARTTAAVAGSSISNLATVTANELDPNPGNNQATATIHVQPLVDLQLAKVASNLTPAAGGPVTYRLSLVNNGPSPATGVTLTDPLPSGLSFVSATAGQGTCGASGQTVTCHLGTLAAGGATVVTMTANVAASAAGVTLANTATASANEPVARPELLRSEASITPTRPAPIEADLALAKTVNHADARTGQALTYTITVINHGPATAASPTVTDAFSEQVKIVSVHTSSGSCKHNHTITCHLASIPSGVTDKITIVVKPTITGHLRNSASVASPTPDPNPANNTAHVTTKVRPGPAALRLTKTASRRTVAPGQAFSFTIAVHSLGPEPALGVQVCDRLGTGMAFNSVDHATFRQGSACWKISSLAKGKARRFVVKVRALSAASGERRLTNVATASADGVRTRTARASVMVAPPPPRPVSVTG
jgi:uncharacterized repeat protein (TIGR01451 family)